MLATLAGRQQQQGKVGSTGSLAEFYGRTFTSSLLEQCNPTGCILQLALPAPLEQQVGHSMSGCRPQVWHSIPSSRLGCATRLELLQQTCGGTAWPMGGWLISRADDNP